MFFFDIFLNYIHDLKIYNHMLDNSKADFYGFKGIL